MPEKVTTSTTYSSSKILLWWPFGQQLQRYHGGHRSAHSILHPLPVSGPEEYLGKDYPLFFESFDELHKIVADEGLFAVRFDDRTPVSQVNGHERFFRSGRLQSWCGSVLSNR